MDFSNIKNIIGTILGAITLIGIILGAHTGYNKILTNIGDNKVQIEKTQMMILKSKVREYETKKCKVSNAEWDEYIEDYSALYELKKIHKKISASTPWKPSERIFVNKEGECRK